MIKFKWNGKRYKSTELTDCLVTLFGGTGILVGLDWFISFQENILPWIK